MGPQASWGRNHTSPNELIPGRIPRRRWHTCPHSPERVPRGTGHVGGVTPHPGGGSCSLQLCKRLSEGKEGGVVNDPAPQPPEPVPGIGAEVLWCNVLGNSAFRIGTWTVTGKIKRVVGSKNVPRLCIRQAVPTLPDHRGLVPTHARHWEQPRRGCLAGDGTPLKPPRGRGQRRWAPCPRATVAAAPQAETFDGSSWSGPGSPCGSLIRYVCPENWTFGVKSFIFTENACG